MRGLLVQFGVMSRWIGSGAVTVVLLLSAFGCSTVPETGRSQFNLISPSMERAMGRDAFTRMKASNTLSQDQNATAMVQRVGQRIAAVADLPKAQWEFVLFENSEANAFCLPGGKVGCTRVYFRLPRMKPGWQQCWRMRWHTPWHIMALNESAACWLSKVWVLR